MDLRSWSRIMGLSDVMTNRYKNTQKNNFISFKYFNRILSKNQEKEYDYNFLFSSFHRIRHRRFFRKFKVLFVFHKLRFNFLDEEYETDVE